MPEHGGHGEREKAPDAGERQSVVLSRGQRREPRPRIEARRQYSGSRDNEQELALVVDEVSGD